jgi:hypothetical protein
MRMAIITLFVVTAALVGETQIGNAQSPYSYPWCAILPGAGSGSGGAMSCYYTSWDQCKATMAGIGGLCIESPYYHQQPAQLPQRALVKPRHRRHA